MNKIKLVSYSYGDFMVPENIWSFIDESKLDYFIYNIRADYDEIATILKMINKDKYSIYFVEPDNDYTDIGSVAQLKDSTQFYNEKGDMIGFFFPGKVMLLDPMIKYLVDVMLESAERTTKAISGDIANGEHREET